MQIKADASWIAVGLGPLVMYSAVARVAHVRAYQKAMDKLRETGQECEAKMSIVNTSKDCYRVTHCFLDVSFIAQSQRVTVEKLEVSRNFYDQIKRELSSVEGNSVNAKVMYDPTCLLRFSPTQENSNDWHQSDLIVHGRDVQKSTVWFCAGHLCIHRSLLFVLRSGYPSSYDSNWVSLPRIPTLIVKSWGLLWCLDDVYQIGVMLILMLLISLFVIWALQKQEKLDKMLLRKGQVTAARRDDSIGVGTRQTPASVELAVTQSYPKGTAESNDGNMFDDMDQNTAMSMDDDISKVPSGMSEGKVLSTHEVNHNATDSGMEAPPAYDASLPPAYGTEDPIIV